MKQEITKQRLWERWDVSNILFEEYRKHIRSAKKLTLHELLLIKNFKWWSAVFPECMNTIENKLSLYFEKIQEYQGKKLTEEQLIRGLFDLVKNKDTNIKWFSYSFLSAMLAMFFPETFPVMDWRVLSAKEIIENNGKKNSYWETESKNVGYIIEKHPLELYLKLFEKLTDESRKAKKTMRELDRKYFSLSALNKTSIS